MKSTHADDLIRATLRITVAYLARNMVSPGQLSSVIRDVHDSLSAMGRTTIEPEAPGLTPAVSIRRSVRHDAVVCMECGKEMRVLRRHLGVEHGLSIPEYKAKWRLPADHPVVAPDYARQRSEWAKSFGLGLRATSKRRRKKT